ncbi:MAG TPA: non-homologous end-joining DNA ligase [Acidimicrobiia bacterium]|nr:non-homologous end-joining DNA ligase [Acidimicrobiia bacterium]
MKVTHPDRVVFPDDGITKGEVVAYYTRVADRMLPFIEERALSVERFPQGIGGKGFMQKNVPDHYPEALIGRHEVPKEDGGTTVYPVVDNTEGIVFFANLGVITFHVPPVRIDDQDQPDWAIWDLDPPPDRVDLVREAALAMRSILEDHGISTLPMSSGSKGYHLRTRLKPTVDMETVSGIARGTAALAATAHDDIMTLAFRKAERGDRVFVDWMRNTARSTSVVPWSLRPRAGAPLATPIGWDELGSIEPDGIGLRDVDQRLEDDPWGEQKPLDLFPAVESVERALATAGIELEPFDRFRS